MMSGFSGFIITMRRRELATVEAILLLLRAFRMCHGDEESRGGDGSSLWQSIDANLLAMKLGFY
jgi:hypothetical protein